MQVWRASVVKISIIQSGAKLSFASPFLAVLLRALRGKCITMKSTHVQKRVAYLKMSLPLRSSRVQICNPHSRQRYIVAAACIRHTWTIGNDVFQLGKEANHRS